MNRHRSPALGGLMAAAVAVWSAACASSGGVPVPRPFPTPGSTARREPPPAVPAPATDPATAEPAPTEGAPRTDVPAPPIPTGPTDYYALVGTALHLRGTPYRDGGADPQGFDCSGFTQYVFAQYGVTLPRAVRDQYKIGSGVKSGVEPGDLLFFTTTAPGASHVAIAVGRDEFVHAPSSTGVVRVERLSSSYWAQRYIGARRVGN